MLTRRSLMGSATALALLMGIAAPAFADPDAALAKLQETVLSKGPSGEDPSPASDVVLSDEELAQRRYAGSILVIGELLEDAPVEDAELVETELLVEEISIDGMCGVY